MDLIQLKYFCDSAETQNFSHTAKKYFVPASSVSQSVKRLEKELGVELFEHLGNKIILADKGKEFYEKVNKALLLLEDAKKSVTDVSNNISGEIVLRIFCNRHLVSHAIEKFREAYPSVNFVIQYTKENHYPCDIIISDNQIDGYFEKFLLVKEDILLAVSQKHPLSKKTKIGNSDLEYEKFISTPKGYSLYNITEELCNREGFFPNIAIQTEDPYYIRNYVKLGLGIAFIPSFSWKDLFSDGVVLKKFGSYQRKTYVFLPKSRKMKPVASAFLEYLNKVKPSGLSI